MRALRVSYHVIDRARSNAPGRRWLAAVYGFAVALGTTAVGIKSLMMALAIAGLLGAVGGKPESERV